MARFLAFPVAVVAAVALPVSVGTRASGPARQVSAAQPPQTAAHRAFLDKYCVTCHNARLKTAGLVLEGADLGGIGDRADTWEKVLRKVRTGMMPPAGRPRPDAAASAAFSSYLLAELDRSAAVHPVPGRVDPLRRLNRTEYRNAVRDLLALDIDVADLLPSDDSSSGFDNISLAGLDAGRLERYLTAAKKVSRAAVGASVRAPDGTTVIVPSDLVQNDRLDGMPFGTRGGVRLSHTFPADGEYEFQVRLGRSSAGAGVASLTEPHDVVVLVDGAPIKTFTVSPRGNDTAREADADLNIRLPVKAGPHTVVATFISHGARLNDKQRTSFQRLHVTVGEDQRTQPTLYSLTVLGPYGIGGVGDTPSRQRIFLCHPAVTPRRPAGSAGQDDETACARRIVSTLARRAYRRPVTDADVAPLLAFFEDGRREAGFDAGIEDAVRRLLVSPEFLFRLERDPANLAPGATFRVSDLELASRLSFFLWSSIPDDELLEVAGRGRLRDDAVLDRQVRRMLADPRAEALVTNFASQWLYLRNLDGARPDAQLFPDFDESLRQALRRETELFVQSILREDRSAIDFLRANYTFVNERLARHYGIPDVYGSQFRRVTFEPGSPRGGLLSQGSILTVTAYASRTSPVVRGKWVLQNILGTPPPPPPPNVPPLPDTKTAVALTMRERMAAHRKNPVCAGCHSLMDPIGLSLENFDATGRWRVRTEAFAPLDVTGTLPDGTAFDGVPGLKAALVARADQFVDTFTERLLTYALGRPVAHFDLPVIRHIVRNAQPGGYRLSAIVGGIVRSTPFQMKATGGAKAPQTTVAAGGQASGNGR
jgi:hypothetical protein